MRQARRRLTALFLALSMLLSLAACGGGGNAAATMHLVKTEGTVQVDDAEGKPVAILENLGLYSGYGVSTQADSYGWISLDDTKLAKLDADSQVEIQKEGKLLELHVQSGGLFFNVTEPLAEDETMNIRTSSMLVGIRGTCGWVEVADESHMTLYLLEGKVECSTGAETAAVSAGEKAAMTADGEIAVSNFTAGEVPSFVAEEIQNDEALAAAILEDSGLDVLNPPSPAPEDTQAPLPEDTQGPLPVDENRIVFTGTLRSCTDEELIALQQIPDNETQGLRDGRIHWIIQLDTPQEMALSSAGDPGALYSREVTIVDVTFVEGIEARTGHLTFSIDPYNTWWPSDVSLPLGQPRTSDLMIY